MRRNDDVEERDQEEEKGSIEQEVQQKQRDEEPLFQGIREKEVVLENKTNQNEVSSSNEATDTARPKKKKQSLFAQRKAQLLKAKQANEQNNSEQVEEQKTLKTAHDHFPQTQVIYVPNQIEEEKEEKPAKIRDLMQLK